LLDELGNWLFVSEGAPLVGGQELQSGAVIYGGRGGGGVFGGGGGF
jgi:hypothetical protein